MSEFVLIDIDEIRGSKYDFYKLEINGVCPFDDFEESLSSNPQYLSQFRTIFFLCTVLCRWIANTSKETEYYKVKYR